MARNYIGVDLAKDFLEVCDPVRGRSRVANRPKAVAHWVAGLGETDFVVYEATSGCDRPLRVALAEAGRPGARVNPLHAWHYARSRNRAKTDRLDAALLADYGRERQPAPDPALDPAREALRALVGRRDQLRRMEVQEKNRLSGCLAEGAPALVVRDVRAGLARLARSLAKIEAAIRDEVAGDATLARDARLLRSIPDIGPVTAVTLLAWLAELGHTDRRAAASLAGVAPRARELGQVSRQALPRRRPQAGAAGALHGGTERAAPPRLPRRLRPEDEGGGEAGEGHPDGGGPPPARRRKRRPAHRRALPHCHPNRRLRMTPLLHSCPPRPPRHCPIWQGRKKGAAAGVARHRLRATPAGRSAIPVPGRPLLEVAEHAAADEDGWARSRARWRRRCAGARAGAVGDAAVRQRVGEAEGDQRHLHVEERQRGVVPCLHGEKQGAGRRRRAPAPKAATGRRRRDDERRGGGRGARGRVRRRSIGRIAPRRSATPRRCAALTAG